MDADLRARALKLLREIEWGDEFGHCPRCAGGEPEPNHACPGCGHASDRELAALIRELEG